MVLHLPLCLIKLIQNNSAVRVYGRVSRWSLTLNIPSLARQRCLPSWGPRRTPWFWCGIHLWFRLMGSLQAKSMTSQRYRAVTRWRIWVTMATLWQQQDGGYALLFYIFNSTDIDWTCFFFVISQLFDAVDYSDYVFFGGVSETIIQWFKHC